MESLIFLLALFVAIFNQFAPASCLEQVTVVTPLTFAELDTLFFLEPKDKRFADFAKDRFIDKVFTFQSHNRANIGF